MINGSSFGRGGRTGQAKQTERSCAPYVPWSEFPRLGHWLPRLGLRCVILPYGLGCRRRDPFSLARLVNAFPVCEP